MNIIANNPILRITAFCLLGTLGILTSCERNDNPTEGMDIPNRNTQFMLQPPTISVEPFGGSTPAKRAAVTMKEERQAFNVGEELGNIITLGNSETEDTPQTRAFANGTYYRIVVYKLSEWNAGTLKVHEQRLCKTGSTSYCADVGDVTDPILLDYGDYRIFCYSFNKTTADKLSPLADGSTDVLLTEGDDFLSSEIISLHIAGSQLGTDVALGSLTLKHRCCRLIGTLTAVAFSSTGISSSPTPSLSVTSTFFTTGNWSIKNTSFSGSATSGAAKAIPLSVNGNNYIGTLMLLPLSGKSLTTSYTFKPNGAPKNVTASDKTISSSATFSSGGSYSFTIQAVCAYVPTETNPVQIGSYKWAYANLDGTTKKLESKPWISGPLTGSGIPPASGSTTASDTNNDWWRWAVLDIDISGSSVPAPGNPWNTSIDPCRAGLGSSWKIPPRTYFTDLLKYKAETKNVYINGEIMTTNTYGWVKGNNTVGCVFLDLSHSTCIFLPAAGIRSKNSYNSVGVTGNYWTATIYANQPSYGYAYLFDVSKSAISYSERRQGHSLRCAQ